MQAWVNKTKLNKTVFKSLGNMRTKLKKAELAALWGGYTTALEKFKANPVIPKEEQSDDDDKSDQDDDKSDQDDESSEGDDSQASFLQSCFFFLSQ